MNFEWDEDKNQSNIAKHGFDFNDAGSIFDFPMLVDIDQRQVYGEERWVGIGLLGDTLVVIVYTEPADDVIRVISLRKALKHERKYYEEYLADELGSN